MIMFRNAIENWILLNDTLFKQTITIILHTYPSNKSKIIQIFLIARN